MGGRHVCVLSGRVKNMCMYMLLCAVFFFLLQCQEDDTHDHDTRYLVHVTRPLGCFVFLVFLVTY